ncbi:uncharacterized protein CLUP02_13710 [Colletotrichum lupini]|uniref:Uncharacterized protein n=1 Tax=Colletotrichum lupini TaxID=145971 RepID=A0A9Q8T4Q1_9PEZI|nr:uncharacterized protein CLUP02_13710 [Colletotrichum lupini]UQC88187.1 hypothetical protein CLUP02_13710 [Colletotrichum lupini]
MLQAHAIPDGGINFTTDDLADILESSISASFEVYLGALQKTTSRLDTNGPRIQTPGNVSESSEIHLVQMPSLSLFTGARQTTPYISARTAFFGARGFAAPETLVLCLALRPCGSVNKIRPAIISLDSIFMKADIQHIADNLVEESFRTEVLHQQTTGLERCRSALPKVTVSLRFHAHIAVRDGLIQADLMLVGCLKVFVSRKHLGIKGWTLESSATKKCHPAIKEAERKGLSHSVFQTEVELTDSTKKMRKAFSMKWLLIGSLYVEMKLISSSNLKAIN